MTLTDEDRAAIAEAWKRALDENRGDRDSVVEPIYLAGLRAGMQRAAQICEAEFDDSEDTVWAPICATAIREAAK